MVAPQTRTATATRLRLTQTQTGQPDTAGNH